MTRRIAFPVPSLVAVLLLVAAPAAGAERFAILAVGDPPAGPDGDLAELAYQLRAACRDRVPNVEDPSSMRARLLGQISNATESELDRAYGGALAVFQNGEFESSLRTLRAIVEDLESLPETDESYRQWKRALLRLAHSALAANDTREAENAFGKLARVEPGLMPDPDQFSPGFRKRFEEAKARVKALPRRKLTVTAVGVQGNVFVNGKPMGTTPLTVTLPTGGYRVGGAAGSLRVPSFRVELEQEDRAVVLDFALAASLRMNAGPGLVLAPSGRADGVVRAGAWLGVDSLVVVSRSEEGQAQFLVGSIYDILRGALLREGSVRMVAGGVPSVNLSALAAFLLTGQSSREVKDLSRESPRHASPPPVASVAAERNAIAAAAASSAAIAIGQLSAPPARAAPIVPAPPVEPKPVAIVPAPAAASAAPIAATAPVAGAAPVAVAVPSSVHAARRFSSPADAPTPPFAATAVESTPSAAGAPAKAQLDARPAVQPGAGNPPPIQLPENDQGSHPGGGGKRWMGPAAIGAGVLALGLAGLAVQQKSVSTKAYADAENQIQGDGTFKNTEAQARWSSLRTEGAQAQRNAALSAGAAVALTVSACILGWNAWRSKPQNAAMLTFEF